MIENFLTYLANLPLEWLALVGSFLEEIVAPIPSPFVMTTIGAAISEVHLPWWEIGLLVVLGAVGKTLAATIVYYAGDLAEDIIIGRFGKLVGVSHKSVEKFGKLFTHTWWDDVVLFLLRAMPMFPSFLISFGSGALRIDLLSYTLTTFFGTLVRNAIYVAVGYYGFKEGGSLLAALDGHWVLVGLLLVTGIITLVAVMHLKDFLIEKFFSE